MQAFDVVLDAGEHTVTQNGKPVDLTPNEFLLLEQLMRNRGLPSTAIPFMSGYGAVTGPKPIPAPWICTLCGCAANCTGMTISKPFTASATA